MGPFSYTGIKIIYNEQIEEVMEQHRLYAEQEVQEQSLFQSLGTFLARFINQPDRKHEKPLPGCTQ